MKINMRLAASRIEITKATALLTLVVALVTRAEARSHKGSPDLAAQNRNTATDVIIQFATPPTEKQQDKVAKYGG